MDYSFWADEAYISGIASQLVTGKYSLFQAFNALSYQKLYILVITAFFKLFGTSEIVARLPSMIAFVVGIGVIFFLAKKLSNIYGGLLSTFLYAFSHLNLAYATQAKPYAIIETILLIILYLLTNKKTNHLLIIFLCSIVTLLHSIGVFLWILYGTYLLLKIKKTNIFIIFLTFVLGLIFIYPMIFSFIKAGQTFPYNHLYQSIKLFTYKYSFISLSAFFGFVWSFKKNKTISIALLIYSLVVFIMATFQQFIFNIRYVLSLFGILFLYFGIFWAKVGEKYLPKRKWLIPIAVMILLYVTGYKIVRLPQVYYNPNLDKYGDVQIANYKDFYAQLKKRFPNYKKLYVINDTQDAESWYFGRYSNTYFMKFTPESSFNDFKKVIKDHPQGLLIMEDWESLFPEDIKQYAKKNLKLELRVESLREAPDDPWPLALYSWGIN
ncbi:glycosyltransferase family 39 protein [Candidatus Roizmanbacteria bacterium]|nr:glycosyltransferase family 39 protein [Candidatus Roizmanbacteria bacterium]